MRKYILKRLLISAATLFVMLVILFLLLELMPGSPFNDVKLSPEQRAGVGEAWDVYRKCPAG